MLPKRTFIVVIKNILEDDICRGTFPSDIEARHWLVSNNFGGEVLRLFPMDNTLPLPFVPTSSELPKNQEQLEELLRNTFDEGVKQGRLITNENLRSQLDGLKSNVANFLKDIEKEL